MKKIKTLIPLAGLSTFLSIVLVLSCNQTKKLDNPEIKDAKKSQPEPDKEGKDNTGNDSDNASVAPTKNAEKSQKLSTTPETNAPIKAEKTKELQKYQEAIAKRKDLLKRAKDLKISLSNENAMYKYEVVLDRIDLFLDENKAVFANSEHKELVASNIKLEEEFNKINALASELKNAEDKKPDYAPTKGSGVVNKGKGKKENSTPEYPELLAIENSLKNNKNNSKNDVNTALNTQVEDFLNIVQPQNLTSYQDNSYSVKERNEIAAFVNDLMKKSTNDSFIGRIKHIYDWIISSVKYARGDEKQYISPHDVFKYKVAVCGGISSLYKAMLDVIGVKSVMVTGWSSAGAHQWVMFYNEENKKWVHSDATWGIVNSQYFMKSSSEISNDHRADEVLDTTIEEGQILYKYWHGLSVLKLKEGSNTELKVPANVKGMPVKSISIRVYSNKNMTHLHIGDNVEKIDYEIAPQHLKEYIVSSKNKHFAAKDGILYSKDYSKLISTPVLNPRKSIILPKELNEIEDGKNSFSAPALEKIIVEPGNYSFASYQGVLYNNDFSKLITVQGGKNKVIAHKNVKFGGNEFSSKPDLKEVILEDGITELVDFTFNGLQNLKSVFIPNSVKKISDYAFNMVPSNIILLVPSDNKLVKEYASKKKFTYKVQKNKEI
ncbi:lipoprotein [Mycoplasmopsis californica]|uniref:Lipoprotein n=1 Tax=Mycoplasmopsis californica TaxID=2113 RepID=A0A059XR85_9BACT|nr:transglutaminase domain-containing protein [Mycoplasmopsis californica]AIA29268.1 lipoprotein [Mycoplasmopsis californica]